MHRPAEAAQVALLLLLALPAWAPCCLASAASGIGIIDAGVLQPGLQLNRQTLDIGHHVHSYRLASTTPSTSYEVRVSHPSFIPVALTIWLAEAHTNSGAGAISVSRRQSLRRKLLDCDKLILTTNAHNTLTGLQDPRVHIKAVSTAVTRRLPDGSSAALTDPALVYNIVLQPLYLGVIPADTLPVILYCGALILALWKFIPWWADRAVPRLLSAKVSGTAALPVPYTAQGGQALSVRRKQVKALLSNKRLPQDGWDDLTIQMLIQDCSMMDSNNFPGNVGVGEREGRVACPLVAARHYHLAHGIGRSGDIAAEQPKAAGSSLLAKLTTHLTQDALRLAGLGDLGAVSVLPLATGMAMTLCLMTIRSKRPPTARTVLWSRVDQKTCLKAITAAGLDVRVIELKLVGDELCTDLEALEAAVRELGPEAVCAVVTTTSCFAPRACDDVVSVAKLCAAHGIPHMINNAYGVQCKELCHRVTSAWRKGRVDVVVQSTDKNFMVPVGGAVIMEGGPHSQGVVAAVNQSYPGRASMSVHLDLLMTLLHWGAKGWQKVLSDRESLYQHMSQVLAEAAAVHGQRVLSTPNNPISLAVTLDQGDLAALPDHTFLGSMLWARFVSGTRVVGRGKQQTVAGVKFTGYGSHTDQYPHVYLTAAAALGGSVAEADEFCVRLGKCIREALAKHMKTQAQSTDQDQGAVVQSCEEPAASSVTST